MQSCSDDLSCRNRRANKKIEPKVSELIGSHLSARWVSLRLLDGDETLLEELSKRFVQEGE